LTDPLQLVENYWQQGRKIKRTASGWLSGNAACCVHNGESLDKRSRGGLIVGAQEWGYSCFNCGFNARFVLGQPLSYNARRLLTWLNVPQEDIERVNLESLRHKSTQSLLEQRAQTAAQPALIHFDQRPLPSGLLPVDQSTPQALTYLQSRCVSPDFPVFYMPKPRPGVLIPFAHRGQTVGNTIRFLDNRPIKYLHDMPHGYVFGIDQQQPHWSFAVVVEGVFDAMSIQGLAVLHNDINAAQVQLIRSLNRDIVVVPDQDTAGMALVDRAIELGWSVSMPEWPADCKDVNDAVIRMGRVAAMITIQAARETSSIKIQLQKKKLLRRLRGNHAKGI
jgi:hypothetical protein